MGGLAKLSFHGYSRQVDPPVAHDGPLDVAHLSSGHHEYSFSRDSADICYGIITKRLTDNGRIFLGRCSLCISNYQRKRCTEYPALSKHVNPSITESMYLVPELDSDRCSIAD